MYFNNMFEGVGVCFLQSGGVLLRAGAAMGVGE